MKTALVAVLLAAVAVAAFARPVLDDSLIESINADPTSTWTAGRNARFEGVTLTEAMGLLGHRQKSSHLAKKVHTLPTAIPASFDARQQWPNCIHPIRDQEQCGSCWAFGATEALSDRLCIQHNVNVVLAPQDLVSCDTTDDGCNGGYLDNAWQYMVKNGVVADKCLPYTSGDGSVEPCPKGKCKGSGSWQKYYASNSYDVSKDVAQIQTEIMTNGPVEGGFDVYQDFFSYKSGVYTHKSGGLAGGHAIKILGWGTLGGVDYWLVANSWGTSWGQSGFFMIKRGTDECGIESNVVAGMAKASSTPALPGASSAELSLVERPLVETDMVLDEEMIRKVNTLPGNTWKAEHSSRFHKLSVKEARRMLGAQKRTIHPRAPVVLHAESIPDTFDSRTQWPGCVHPVRDQQQCGSCWAFAASEALSDRFCIASKNSVNVVLSPQSLVSCDTTDYGCDGGYLDHAWDWMATHGVTTDSCTPYTSGDGSVAPCAKTCKDGSAYKLYQVQAGSVKTVTDEASIQTAIMTGGPVEAAFTVYQDFFSYKSGVYTHQYGSAVGGHAVKIVGWGVQNSQKYWLIANSWGTSWGQSGFFMIARGSDECGIEDDVVFGTPKI